MLESRSKTQSESKIPNEIFEKITRSLKKLNSFFEGVKAIMDSPNFVVPQTSKDDNQAIIDNLFEPLTSEEDIKFFDEYFTNGDDAIWQQASKEDREVWNQLKPLSIYLKSKGSQADIGIARNTNLGTKELVSLCIILTNSAKVHNTNPLTSNLFVYLSKQLVKDFHTGRLESEERRFDSDQHVNEQELNLLNIMLLDNIKDECSDEYFDTLASQFDLMGLKRAWVPYCSLQKFEQDFKYDFYQQTFEYLKELGVVQGEQLRNRSSISPTEAKGKYEFKKHIQDCRCQLQSMFRVNKSSKSLEVITDLPTNGI